MKRLTFGLLLMTLPSQVGCDSTQVQQSPPKAYSVFYDKSGSTLTRENPQWLAGLVRIERALTFGDSIEVYAINARTKDNAPLYRGNVPRFPEDGTMDEKAKVKRELARIRRDIHLVFLSVLKQDRSTYSMTTDVLGFVERSSPDPQRQNVSILFTDGLESADPKLNLEKACLTSLNVRDAIQELASRRKWSLDALRGDVHIVLPEASGVRNCNSARELQAFFSVLIKALGGNLAAFNTYLTL